MADFAILCHLWPLMLPFLINWLLRTMPHFISIVITTKINICQISAYIIAREICLEKLIKFNRVLFIFFPSNNFTFYFVLYSVTFQQLKSFWFLFCHCLKSTEITEIKWVLEIIVLSVYRNNFTICRKKDNSWAWCI